MYSLPFAISDRTRRPPPGRASRTLDTDAAAAAKRTAVILAVDDQPDALAFLRVLCESEGYEFLAATSGAQALELCGSRRPDLAIVDIMMPGMTGFELCDLLRSDMGRRDIPIIVYSAHEVKPYSSSGQYDVALVKPAEPDDLLRAIRMLLPDAALG